MTRSQIIEAVHNREQLSFEQIAPFRTSLRIYFEDYFCGSEPLFLATLVTNAICGGKIVSADEVFEAIEEEIREYELTGEDADNERETLLSNLSKL